MKYSTLVFLFCFGSATAQTDSIVSMNLHQLSLGINPISQFRNQNTVAFPVCFVKIRNHNHAFRLSYSTTSYYSSANNHFGTPYYISLADTQLVFRSYFYEGDNNSFDFSYEWYQPTYNPRGFEVITGIGLNGGYVKNHNYYIDNIFLPDSTGTFKFIDSLSHTSKQIDAFTYEGFRFGFTPYFGLNYMAANLFTLGAEVYAPFTCTLKNPYQSDLPSSTLFGFNLVYSLDLIVNFNFHTKYKTAM